MHDLDSLKTALSGLYQQLGTTENIWLGLVVNLTTLAIGVVGYLTLSGWAQFGIAVFGLLGALGIIGWVLNL